MQKAQKRSRMTLGDRLASENEMMLQAMTMLPSQYEFSYTPSDVIAKREKERAEKQRRRERRRTKRGMKDLLPKKKQGQDYWKSR